MSASHTPEQSNALYYQCFEKLLPVAGQHIKAVALDWWDLDRFLGVAFYTLLAETDPRVRMQMADLLPHFGAKAVPPLIVLRRQQNLDTESIELLEHSLTQISSSDLITGLIDVLKASEDDSFDESVCKRLAKVGNSAIAAVETLSTDPEWRTLALKILPRIQKFQAIGHLNSSFRSSATPSTPAELSNGESKAAMGSQISCKNGPELNSPNRSARTIDKKSTALMQIAAAKAETNAYLQAINIYTQALNLCPDNARAYGARGLLRSNVGDQQGAIADIQYAAQLFRQQGKTANFEIALGYLRKIMSQVPS
ncbi:hypothetical protein C1752_03746 [Acaryochloris thomasi RCC1774]|uniref:Uncharacterized protein n=1 Tax=Acaryochloris thomasi RCC1774 TaxID=1764569 RepID=A0A2W1JFJ7_9CYAN|nr:hypothetical protein [Acaryochloris thomasi]PZD72429.1 hypothetical protein C1752_03746 [Acaryochloris thomasi RCC1774]